MQRPTHRLFGLATGAYATRRSIVGGPGHRGPETDHFDGTVFRNQNPEASAGKDFSDFLRWQRTSRPARWPEQVANRETPRLPRCLQRHEYAVTFVNHITFLVQFRGLNLLTDPVYAERVSPVRWAGPKRVRPPGLPFDQLPKIDVVLLSHNHYDHLDLDTLLRLEHAHRPLILTGLGNQAFLAEHGLERVREFDWWQEATASGARFIYTPAQHWSGRGMSGRNKTLWGGFVVEADGRQLFFAGDTGYWQHFSEVRQRCGAPDLAILPIGAYEPRWFMQDQHMNPAEAVRAHLDLAAGLSLGSHFGCFQLTDEAIDAPVRELAIARRRYRVDPDRFRVLETGETLQVPG